MTIRIATLHELHELYEAVDLQKIYWGTEVESLVPAQTMHTIVQAGGHVIAAYDGDRMVGVLIGFLAADGTPARDHLKFYSKRMVVLPEYRGQRIAERMKWRQRELALSQGVELITWTYDPLLSVNAHFNIRKLGCQGREYIVNYYGTNADNFGLATLGVSDRLVAEMWVHHPGVMARVNEDYAGPTLDDYADATLVNPSVDVNGVAHPGEVGHALTPYVLLEIPTDFRGLVNALPDVARAWQAHNRELFKTWVEQNRYVVMDFLHIDYEGRRRAFYVLCADNERV